MLDDKSYNNYSFNEKKQGYSSSINNFCSVFCCCFFSSYKHEPVVINTTPRGSSPRPSNTFLADRLRSSMNQTIEMGNMLAEDKFKDENIPLKPSINVASL